jgi:hypothetical protein
MSHFSATQKKLPGRLGDVGGYCIYIYINQEKVSFASESTAISINQYISYTSQGWFHTFTGNLGFTIRIFGFPLKKHPEIV